MKALVLALLQPGTALADDRPVAPDPATCTPLLTVQKTGCVAEHVYRCAGGEMLNVQVDLVHGELYRGTVLSDADFNPLFADDGPDLAVSFGSVSSDLGNAHLIASGHGAATVDFTLWLEPSVDPLTGIVRRQVDVTDQALVIDGVALLRLRAEADFILSGGAFRFGGWEDVYIEPNIGVRFTGSWRSTAYFSDPETWTEDPIALIYPGEPGFMNDPSETDCDPVGSLAPRDLGKEALG